MTAELVLITVSDNDIRNQRSFGLGEILTIGREPGNDVYVDDNQISRFHALVRCNEGEYVILDLGSSNGTFVNDKPVSAPTLLRDNDVIKLGTARLVFRLKGEAATPVQQQGTTRSMRKARRVLSRTNLR